MLAESSATTRILSDHISWMESVQHNRRSCTTAEVRNRFRLLKDTVEDNSHVRIMEELMLDIVNLRSRQSIVIPQPEVPLTESRKITYEYCPLGLDPELMGKADNNELDMFCWKAQGGGYRVVIIEPSIGMAGRLLYKLVNPEDEDVEGKIKRFISELRSLSQPNYLLERE